MRIVVASVGKIRDASLRAVADDYFDRIRRYARCDEIELKSAEGFARTIPDGAFVVALEPDGRALTSERFATLLGEWTSRSKGIVVFAIGGADGLPRDVAERADVRLSVSTLTLPHRLARVVLAEQIYRAFTIQRGEPYARE